MANGDFYKAVAKGLYKGVVCENAFWYQQVGDSTATNIPEQLAGFLKDVWAAQLLLWQSPDFQWTSAEAANYSTPSPPALVPMTGAGGVGGDSVATWLSATIIMGRSAIGRNYPQKRVTGFTETSFDGNDLEEGFRLDLMNIGNDMRVKSITGGGFLRWVTISPSPKLADFPLNSTFKVQEVGTAVNAVLGTQKTRKP